MVIVQVPFAVLGKGKALFPSSQRRQKGLFFVPTAFLPPV
jgi:hypothetical protein